MAGFPPKYYFGGAVLAHLAEILAERLPMRPVAAGGASGLRCRIPTYPDPPRHMLAPPQGPYCPLTITLTRPHLSISYQSVSTVFGAKSLLPPSLQSPSGYGPISARAQERNSS